MSPARKPAPDLTAATPVREAARLILRERLDVVLRRLKAVGGEAADQAEAVHQVRVATRRAAAALAAFAPWLPPAKTRRLRRRLRKVRRVAGRARDWDVLAQHVQEGSGGRKAEAAAVAFVVEQAGRRREQEQAGLTSLRKTRKKLRRLTRRLLRSLKRPGPGNETTLHDAARVSVPALSEALRAAAEGDLSELDRLHEVRLRGKRLRYALEVFAPCLDPKADRRLHDDLKEMQDLLGRINDCRQTLDQLDRLRAEHQEPSANGRPRPPAAGMNALERRHRAALKRCQKQFQAWWRKFRAGEFFADLAGAVEPPPAGRPKKGAARTKKRPSARKGRAAGS